jgi:ELWxxDGT repeat protein
MTVFKNEVLFNGLDAGDHRGLWVSDGTGAGTHELTGIAGANTSGRAFDPTDFTVFKGKVLFDAVDAAGKYGLWVTDGTVAGTRELTGIKGAYSGGLAPSDFTIVNKNEVVFNGVDASGNHTLWETNGTAAGTRELSGVLNPGSLATVDPTGAVGTVGVSADAFHFASTLGSSRSLVLT